MAYRVDQNEKPKCALCSDTCIRKIVDESKNVQQFEYEITVWCTCPGADRAKIEWEHMLIEQRERREQKVGKRGD